MSVEWFVSSSVLILLVVLVRFLFRKKIRPVMRYALWAVVMLRLLIPVSFAETTVSILNFLPESIPVQADLGDNPVAVPPDEEAGREKTNKEEADSEKISGKETGWKGADSEETSGKETCVEKVSEKTDNGGAINEIRALQMEVSAAESAKSRKAGGIDVKKMLWLIWLSGVLACAAVFVVVNLDYRRRLLRSRKRIASESLPVDCLVPVYFAEIITTPCLSGVFHPAVYVTEEAAAEEKTFAFVLSHENAHYKHLDNWWALVRVLCLCLHWFNPLVWMAARFSGHDGELACDEAVLKGLDERERAAYGRSLLKLSTAKTPGYSRWQITTTMRGSKRELKERLQMVVRHPGRALWAQALLPVLVAVILAVTFTGRFPVNFPEMEAVNIMDVPEEDSVFAEKFSEDNGETVSGDGEEEINDIYGYAMESKKLYPTNSLIRVEDVLVTDLNFDGWDDLCVREGYDGYGNVSCSCMLWNQQKNRFEYNVTLNNVEADSENQWISSKTWGGDGGYSTIYYRYDEEGLLHMVRYVEENPPESDAAFKKLDLTYVEDGYYTLAAVLDEEELNVTMVAMAKQALTELYEWTGEMVNTACFQVTNMGGVTFSVSREDMEHSRVFFGRYFGVDTKYNLSGYDKSISSVGVASGKRVWYSPVLWRVFPDNLDAMTDEEVVIWYFERLPGIGNDKVLTTVKRYEDMWTTQTKSGKWYEVIYDSENREVLEVVGPYPDFPEH